MDHFVLSKSLLTEREQVDLLAAVEGMCAIRYPDALSVQQKLNALFQRPVESWISVDFSSWGCEEEAVFDTLKAGVLQHRAVLFDYYSRSGERTRREVEPLQLCFKHRAWYLYAFCCTRQQLRLFKLTRIQEAELSDRVFQCNLRASQDAVREGESVTTPPATEVLLWLDPSQTYRAYDEFPPEWIERQPDGSMVVKMHYAEDEWVHGYLLSFGAHGRVLSPSHLQEALKVECEKIINYY